MSGEAEGSGDEACKKEKTASRQHISASNWTRHWRYRKPVLLPFYSFLHYFLQYEANSAANLRPFLDRAAILLHILKYSVDSAAILPFLLLYEANLAPILHLHPSYESYSAAISPFTLLHEA